MIKLSIITVNYNDHNGLERTIKSVLSQTWTDYEYIIVDGGSTDGSREVIEKYKDRLAWWCSEPDGGIYQGMNKGVRHAKGEYCIFMNSGDSFVNDSVLEDVAAQHRTEDIISGYNRSDKTGETTRPHSENMRQQVINGDILAHQATFIKTELQRKYPYDEKYRIVSDCKFWVETIVFENCSWAYIDTVIARQDIAGISASNLKLQTWEWLSMWRELLPRYKIQFSEIVVQNIYNLQINRIISQILKAVNENDHLTFQKYINLWNNYDKERIKSILGKYRYIMYVSHPYFRFLKLWIKLHGVK